MELTKERLAAIIIAGALIIILGLYLVLYRPLTRKLNQEYRKYKTIEVALHETHQTIINLKKARLKKSFITEEGISLAINELTKEGRLKGIDFISITPQKIEELKSLPLYKILPIEMEIKSSYNDLGIFLGSLDYLQKSLIVVKSFEIIANKKDLRELQTKLVLNMYLTEMSSSSAK